MPWSETEKGEDSNIVNDSDNVGKPRSLSSSDPVVAVRMYTRKPASN